MITSSEAVNLKLNWATLRTVITREITTCENIAADMADSDYTATRMAAKLEAFRQVMHDMDTLESYVVTLDEDDDGAAERIAETFDQAATDYARTERDA